MQACGGQRPGQLAEDPLDGRRAQLVITGWFVGDGQPVDSGAPLLTVSTDKADFELESPAWAKDLYGLTGRSM